MDLCGAVETIFDVATLDSAIDGPLDPDNPLKWAVFKALQNSAQANSNITPVSYTAVCDPSDTEEWLNVLDLIDGRDDVYGLVPLTRNKTVLDAFHAHIGAPVDATVRPLAGPVGEPGRRAVPR